MVMVMVLAGEREGLVKLVAVAEAAGGGPDGGRGAGV